MDPTYKGLHVPTPTNTVQKKTLNWKRALLIGGGILVGMIVLGFVANLLTPDNTTVTQRMLYRIDALTTLTSNSRGSIQGDVLSKINTDLSVMLNGDNGALKKAVPTPKITPELTAIKKEEADAATTEKLNTAKVNGAFDIVYKTVLIQKIEEAAKIVKDVYGKTSNTTLKQALVTTADHLNTYYQQLKKLP